MATYRNRNDDTIFYGGELFYNQGTGSFTLGPDVT